jgi:hypothetical protein
MTPSERGRADVRSHCVGACEYPRVEASRENDGTVTVRMSQSEAVVLHEAIAFSEWNNDLSDIELRQPVEQKVFSDVQQALVPHIPGLGTDDYQATIDAAYSAINPEPF